MSVNTRQVYVGTPDQLTTGAVLHAPVGTELPTLTDLTPSKVTIDEAFKDGGYVSSDGVTLTPDMSTSDINDWSGALIRRVLEAFNGEVAFTMIQSDAETFKMALGTEYVTAQDADTTHGNQVMAKFGAHLPDPEAWIFKMKDGAARILICLPNAQVTTMDEVTFNATDPIGWAMTLSCYPDSTGTSIYVLTDDGQVASA